MIRLLIAAPYASTRAGLHSLLADTDDFAILDEVSGSGELERVLPEARPDVILFDYNSGDGGRVLAVLAGGDVGLVALCDNRADVREIARCPLPGWACLLKEADGQEIAQAVRAVAAGLIVLDRSLGSLLSPPVVLQDDETLPGEALTTREREVLQQMAQGLANKQIGARLGISLHTVKFHVASILAKLGATSRTEAVTLGARRGYVTL